LARVVAGLGRQDQPNAKTVAPVLYRFRVEGTVGKEKDRQTWRSEAKLLSNAPGGPHSLPARTIED
jgi:hypothetical protein